MSQPVVGADYVTCELVAATNASATTLLVSTPTEPFPVLGAGEYWYLTIIDEASYAIDANPPVQREIVKVTAYTTVSTGYSLTCVRAQGGTTGQIWASGSICEIRPCAIWFQDLKGGDASAWAITDGIVTVNDVTSLFVQGTGDTTVEVTDLGSGAAAMTVNSTGGGTASTSQAQLFTSSGTFTPADGVTGVKVTMIGGGGGGSNLASSAGGGGGGSGEYCVSHPWVVSGPVTVTVGAGGSGAAGDGSGHSGSDGGDTSFDTLVVRGGKGGGGTGSSGAGGGINGGALASAGNIGLIGTAESPTYFGGSSGGGGGNSVPSVGKAGGPSAGYPSGADGGAIASSQGGGGGGGSSIWGVGGVGGSNSAGAAASNYGTGGGGASGKASGSYAGGAGASGAVIVEWISP